MKLEAKKLSQELAEDFFALHSQEPFGWCFCVAWEVPTWDNWNNRTAEKNRMFRQLLFDKKHLEGYLLYLDQKPVGWCQYGPLEELPIPGGGRTSRRIPPVGANVRWRITCFVTHVRRRRRGVAGVALRAALAAIRAAAGSWRPIRR